jgi:hypothetical protein
MPVCIVCQTQDAKREPGQGDFARFDCRRCGAFVLTGTAESTLPTKLDEKPLRRSLMSHTLRRVQRPGDKHLRQISDDELPTFWRNERLPTPQQQADSLIFESRTAFMALKFNQVDLDRVVEECFRPAVTRAGFDLRLITDQQPAGLIDDQLRAAIGPATA